MVYSWIKWIFAYSVYFISTFTPNVTTLSLSLQVWVSYLASALVVGLAVYGCSRPLATGNHSDRCQMPNVSYRRFVTCWYFLVAISANMNVTLEEVCNSSALFARLLVRFYHLAGKRVHLFPVRKLYIIEIWFEYLIKCLVSNAWKVCTSSNDIPMTFTVTRAHLTKLRIREGGAG